MKKLKAIAGITWAFLCLILIIVLFPGLTGFATSLSKAPFMRIHPRYSGGEPEKQIITESCTLVVRKPVFKGLIGDRNNGFVQVDWSGQVPAEIIDTIDYDFDGQADFVVSIDTKVPRTGVISLDRRVGDVRVSTSTSYGWSVRVNLKK